MAAIESEPEIVLDVFLSRQRGGYRFYIAYTSWCPPALKSRAGQDFEIFPCAWPDLADLEQHMRRLDAPYYKKVAKYDGVQLLAQGRSAVALSAWLEAYAALPVVDADRPLGEAFVPSAPELPELRTRPSDSN